MSKPVVTRFAPSPTGYLHIGSARTALFNWLYARGRGGKFLLRIEDTDRARCTLEATQAIFKGLDWLGLDYDSPVVTQFDRTRRHAEVAYQLLAEGKAYKCFSTQEEIAAFRNQARAEGRSTLFRSPWRQAQPRQHPQTAFVVRIKAPQDRTTVIADQVQGHVTIQNNQLDDMILLRSDGTPVYMLAVVVDDFDMGVTTVIRGDDHLNNAARQMMIYSAMGWPVPIWAHIPLIHGPDGKKLSKRHGALGLDEYQAMGYSAAGMRNYLARLGWAHGDNEFFSDAQAQAWFDFDGVGKSPARFDFKKLLRVSGQHIATTEDAALLHELQAFLTATGESSLSNAAKLMMEDAMYCLKERARHFPELIDKAHFILTDTPVLADEKALKTLDPMSRAILYELTPHLQNVSWSRKSLETVTTTVAEAHGIGFGKLAAPMRAALAGRTTTPSVFDMMLVLGRDETIARLISAGEMQ
ncbi:MAG: glutamate--tRNA ligase [Paracoccaceae bacterium]|nr:glutamate--tRNA ligase [Paracoccaceae bacterium]